MASKTIRRTGGKKTVAKPDNGKVRKNFRLPADLVLWMESFAKQKNTNVTQLIVDTFTAMREEHN